MTSVAIITDDAAQYSLKGLSSNISFFSITHTYKKSRPELLPLKKRSSISPPSKQALTTLLMNAIDNFDEVFCITTAKEVDSEFSQVDEITRKYKGRANFHLIDSQTLSAGQGYLVEYASSMLQKHINTSKIDESIREIIPNIYTILCTPNSSYLYASGFIDAGQMIEVEQHSLFSIFTLEDGKFNPIEKLKNMHNVMDYLLEFLAEYESLQRVFFIHPLVDLEIETKVIQQFLEENIPGVLFSEFPSSDFFSSLVGPHGFGLIVIE